MDRITSRKNAFIAQLRALAADAGFRREQGAFVCDGLKLLGEAVENGGVLLPSGGFAWLICDFSDE